MHPFNADFYGHQMKAIVLGYIRPELDYTTRGMCFLDCDPSRSHLPFLIDHPSLTLTKLFHALSIFPDDLIEDIETDKRVALRSLMRPAYHKFAQDKYFDLLAVHEIHP